MPLDFLRTWLGRKADKPPDLQNQPDLKPSTYQFEFKKTASRRRFSLNSGLAPGPIPLGFPVPSVDTSGLSLVTNPTFPVPIISEQTSLQHGVNLQHRYRPLGKLFFDTPSTIMNLAGDSALGFCVTVILVLVTSSIFVAVATFWRDVNGQSALESLGIQYDAMWCARQYVDNQCEDVKIQGTAALCLKWQQCMEADASLVLRSKVITRLLADLVEDFFGHLSNRTLVVVSITAFLVLQRVGQYLEAWVMHKFT